MKLIRPEALLEGVSPWGLLAAGLIIGTSLPVVRKGLRGLFVGMVKGVLLVGDELQGMAQKTTREWSELIEQAKQERNQKIHQSNCCGEVSDLVEEPPKEVSGVVAATCSEV
jgi:hypothetical protein